MGNTSIFDSDDFTDLPNDPYVAAHRLVRNFFAAHSAGHFPTELKNQVYVEAYEIFRRFCPDYGVTIQTQPVELGQDRTDNVNRIVNYFDSVRDELAPQVLARNTQKETMEAQEAAHRRYIEITGKGFVYELNESDLAQIQKLLNRLRELLKNTTDIEEKHRARLLARLEALQAELHRKMTSFENVWGYCIEASYAIARIGEGAKEIRETIKGIISVVAISASVTHQLPSTTQPPFQLPEPKTPESE